MLDIDIVVVGEEDRWSEILSSSEFPTFAMKSAESEMMMQELDAMTSSPTEDFCIEGISSPGEIPLEFCDDTDFFLDNLDSDLPSFSPAACSISAATSTSTTTSSSTTITTTSEGPCCFVDDNASFTLDPAAISTLFNCQQPYESNQLDIIPHAAATYQLPVAPVYNQGQFQQSMCTDAINGGCYSLLLPDSLAVQIPAGPPGQQLPPEYGEYLAPLPPMPGYTGLDPTPTCSFLDAPATNGYYPDAMGTGFFSRAMMIGLEPEMVADGGVVAMPEAVQRVYSSGDMQMMSDCQNLVGGCNSSNTKPLPTSDISALDNVCRLTAEQRKEKIHRYLKKRNERNFSKKIKYACRKTLADNRPRVRGRFAKNELGEATIRASSNHEYDDYEVSSNHEYGDYEVVVKEDQDVLSPDPSTYPWCDLLEIQLQS